MKYRFTLWERLTRAISHAYYWFRTHTWNRYHIVDCRSPINDYSWGWVDRDRLILLACFSILKDFVEKELPHSNTDYSVDGWREAGEEVKVLYAWWCGGRAAEHKAVYQKAAELRLHEIGRAWTGEMSKAGKAINDLDDRDDEMLARLMKIRGYLWT